MDRTLSRDMPSAREKKARVIAFYLPQFHPIPENDAWWGRGFTEWTNVAKAKPLFKGHSQPKLPADLGFYDLRVPEARDAQAALARAYGIEGFCYWHYWFGGGKRLLERPFEEVLQSGSPDFPFCLGWANQTWTGVWHGAPQRILIEQVYPGRRDYEHHFYRLLPAFSDPRYLRIEGMPLFLVYAPMDLPNAIEFTDCWRDLAQKEGLGGVHLMAITGRGWDPKSMGFDSATFHPPFNLRSRDAGKSFLKHFLRKKPTILSYKDVVARFGYGSPLDEDYFPTVLSNWDNTPRCGDRGIILAGSTPENFEEHLRDALNSLSGRPFEKKIIFIKSWNEWAEGNYLEPDREFGHGYLEAVKKVSTECPHG